MEYQKEYRNIAFRVFFAIQEHLPNTLCFAAHPYEMLIEMETSNKLDSSYYLVYGKVDANLMLHVGFREFYFEMTQDLHSRLGLLYEMVRNEHKRVVIKR